MRPPVSRCIYKGCGKSRRKNPGLHMFTIPIKDEIRCKRWILHSACAISLTQLSKPELKYLKICEDHFEGAAFVNSLKQRLVHDAIPKAHQDTVLMSIKSEPLEIPDFEQIFIVSEPFEDYNAATSLYDDEPLLLNRTKNTKTY